VVCRTGAVQVCGNYCGPEWCNGEAVSESQCAASVKPSSPADDCCRLHDMCCGHSKDTSLCNTQIIECLSKLNPADLTCTGQSPIPFFPVQVPVVPPVIEKTMGVIKDWCCGEPCSKDAVAEQVSKVATDVPSVDAIAVRDTDQPETGSHDMSLSVASDDSGVATYAVVSVATGALLFSVVRFVKYRHHRPDDYVSLDFAEEK